MYARSLLDDIRTLEGFLEESFVESREPRLQTPYQPPQRELNEPCVEPRELRLQIPYQPLQKELNEPWYKITIDESGKSHREFYKNK